MSVVCSVGDDEESLDDKLASESDTFVSLISVEISSFSLEVSSFFKFLVNLFLRLQQEKRYIK